MRTVGCIILGGILAVLLGFSPASAEWYGAGYAGIAIPIDQDVDIKGNAFGISVADVTLKDVELDNSVVFGGKVGYFFESWPHFGLELDAYHFNPDVGPQTVQASGTILGLPVVGATIFQEIDIDVTGIAFNALLRGMTARSNDFPEGRFHGYLGVGPGIFISNLEAPGTTLDDTDTVVGGQVLAGMKFFLIDHLSLFGEYKFVFTDEFEFETTGTTVEANIMAHLIYGGIAYHF